MNLSKAITQMQGIEVYNCAQLTSHDESWTTTVRSRMPQQLLGITPATKVASTETKL